MLFSWFNYIFENFEIFIFIVLFKINFFIFYILILKIKFLNNKNIILINF
jgi:hypothetical protein